MTEFVSETPTSVRAPQPAGTQGVLADRLWMLAGADATTVVHTLDATGQGLVLRGQDALPRLRNVHRYRPELPVTLEPVSCSGHLASAEVPLWVPGVTGRNDALLVEDPVAMYVQAQRDAGATVAVVPTGQVRAQDSATFKAVIREANAMDGPALVPLVVAPAWLSDATSRRQLIAGANRLRHSVALGLVYSQGDPLELRGVAAGYREFFEQVPGAIPWRVDLSGLGALACGAPGAVVGQLPSLRRFAEVGKKGYASNVLNRTPHLLLENLARFSRSGHMHTEWFASAEPLTCDLECCDGRALDSFTERQEDDATRHNLVVLGRLTSACLSQSGEARKNWFVHYLQSAVAAHLELGDRIGAPVAHPRMVDQWLAALGAAR